MKTQWVYKITDLASEITGCLKGYVEVDYNEIIKECFSISESGNYKERGFRFREYLEDRFVDLYDREYNRDYQLSSISYKLVDKPDGEWLNKEIEKLSHKMNKTKEQIEKLEKLL